MPRAMPLVWWEIVLCLVVNLTIILVGSTDTIYADHRQNDT